MTKLARLTEGLCQTVQMKHIANVAESEQTEEREANRPRQVKYKAQICNASISLSN